MWMRNKGCLVADWLCVLLGDPGLIASENWSKG
jgi:hypothetical protein